MSDKRIIYPTEAARVAIRAKYNAMQDEIDAASTPEEIKAALGLS